MENITQIKNTILAIVAGVGTFIAQELGGWDAGMKVLVGMMAADYITGVLIAMFWHKSRKTENGTLDSRAGFKGLIKKCMILLMVWIGVLLDESIGQDICRTAVILFFVGNEGLSLVENLAIMGVPCPQKVKGMLEAMHDEGDAGKSDRLTESNK